MTTALWLLFTLGLVGAFDTLYFHEWRGRLVARPTMRPELRLHVARDGIYVIIFATLPVIAWRGWWTGVLAALLVTEIVITMLDFVTEDRVRAEIGGVFPGERVTHAAMGIVYGAMLAYLVPTMWEWLRQPTELRLTAHAVPDGLTWSLLAMSAGILLHGLRDLYAVMSLPGSHWPYPPPGDTARETAPGPTAHVASSGESCQPHGHEPRRTAVDRQRRHRPGVSRSSLRGRYRLG